MHSIFSTALVHGFFLALRLLSIGLSNGSVKHIKVFGSASYVHVPKALGSKLDPKSVLCYFIGYCPTSKACRLRNHDKKKVVVSRDVIFHEQCLYKELILHQLQRIPKQFL